MKHQLFHGKAKNRDQLLKLIRDYKHNKLIDPDTCKILEGVIDIANKRARGIMIPAHRLSC